MTSAQVATHLPDDDLELLLPFYAVGQLTPQQTRLVEARLVQDPEFRRRLDLVEEERGQTVLLNDSIPGPSPAARQRLFALINAEPVARPGAGPARAVTERRSLGRWLESFAAMLTPRAMACAVAGLAALAVVQAGLLAHLASGAREGPAAYVTASAPKQAGKIQMPAGQIQTPAGDEVHVLVRFAAGATFDDIGAWLQDRHMRIVDGPMPGGLWRLRITGGGGKAAALQQLQARPELFVSVLPE